MKNVIISAQNAHSSLFANLESRSIALWIRNIPESIPNLEQFLDFLALPWRMILSETSKSDLFQLLQNRGNGNQYLVRKRGYIHIITSDPTKKEFPRSYLPVYLLNGLDSDKKPSAFDTQLRKYTMLQSLRSSGIQEILVLSDHGDPIPEDLKSLCDADFKPFLSFVSVSIDSEPLINDWIEKKYQRHAYLIKQEFSQITDDILERYSKQYPSDKIIIRIKDSKSTLIDFNITDSDDPQNPLLERYELIQSKDVTPSAPNQLSKDNFISFFSGKEPSWKPYAAGVPWYSKTVWKDKLVRYLSKIEALGAEENCICYIASESGAGGTTVARSLAWHCASLGYPVLFAKQHPFSPETLEISNFLYHIHNNIILHSNKGSDQRSHSHLEDEPILHGVISKNYEVPWVIFFDKIHWESRSNELSRFCLELSKSGRPVCIVTITDPTLDDQFLSNRSFKKIAVLNNIITQDEVQSLGHHLNKFLSSYSMPRKDYEWINFYKHHQVHHVEGLSSFWIALSFWLQGYYDLSESIQSRMFKTFKDKIQSNSVKLAILEIAAMTSERLPFPERLLPHSNEEFPISYTINELKQDLGCIGLVNISAEGKRYWALSHDILGRFLLNALYYDPPTRNELNFGNAQSPEHLRFLILKEIALREELGDKEFRTIGEDFATSIFKIDPDHGRITFALYWKDVLAALDAMSQSLRETSRLFLHHTAISRRRISKLNESLYGLTNEEKFKLLTRAVLDIEYALSTIEFKPGAETNVNLYNSLARAYLDLSTLESSTTNDNEKIREYRLLANDATRRAYEENPTSSFVIETYAKNLLENAKEYPETASQYCINALTILYSALHSNSLSYRRANLGSIADQAIAMLFNNLPPDEPDREPQNEIEVLINAWRALTKNYKFHSKLNLVDIPLANRINALSILSLPQGIGNMQVLQLAYLLTCITYPDNYRKQLELIEQLQATDYRISPQFSLEYAILLYQNSRFTEGDTIFRGLRRKWRETDSFVQVPERLRWLRDDNGAKMVANGVIETHPGLGLRSFASIPNLNNQKVPFRPEEFGYKKAIPGLSFHCFISFGHNGPLLRPISNATKQS